jgi:hypothetical protein
VILSRLDVSFFSGTLHFVFAPRVVLGLGVFARQLQLRLAQHPRFVFVFVGPSLIVFGFRVCIPFFFVGALELGPSIIFGLAFQQQCPCFIFSVWR